MGNGTFKKIPIFYEGTLSLKNDKNVTLEKTFIFGEMELSSPKFKKLLSFFNKKLLYISGGHLQSLKNKNLLCLLDKNLYI